MKAEQDNLPASWLDDLPEIIDFRLLFWRVEIVMCIARVVRLFACFFTPVVQCADVKIDVLLKLFCVHIFHFLNVRSTVIVYVLAT